MWQWGYLGAAVRRQRPWIVLLLGIVAILGLAAPARADHLSMDVQINNARGYQVASTVHWFFNDGGCSGAYSPQGTDAFGRLSLPLADDPAAAACGEEGLEPEDTLRPKRWGYSTAYTDPESCPNSLETTAYTVPEPPPQSVTLTLPNLPLRTARPEVTPDERGLIGAVNGERAKLGRAPLRISSVLSTAADAYSDYLARTGRFGHFELCGPIQRAVEFGWPQLGVGENIYGGSGEWNARDAFLAWMESDPHRVAMLSADYYQLGIGGVSGRWTMMLASDCDDGASASRCGTTTDQGDARLLPASGWNGGGSTWTPPESGGGGSADWGGTGPQSSSCWTHKHRRVHKRVHRHRHRNGRVHRHVRYHLIKRRHRHRGGRVHIHRRRHVHVGYHEHCS